METAVLRCPERDGERFGNTHCNAVRVLHTACRPGERVLSLGKRLQPRGEQ